MSWLALLLIIKIAVTVSLVAIPFLLAPQEKLEATMRINAISILFFRLYGVAIAALVVGYGFGIPAAESGRFPWGVVVMGWVSNAGAALLLLRFSPPRSQGFWLGVFFALMAVALTIALAMPAGALRKVW